ncbi:MAG: serpin family protein [Paludibacteraceae bacterium]|nr:serpin family protein [Paludibacteraceae bacterium]
MGVTSIFDSTANSLKQITDSLYVSNYSHKAKITVNEKGTEAAAASHLNFIVCGVSQNPVKFIADYPFLYAIFDERTGAVLFVGRVVSLK